MCRTTLLLALLAVAGCESTNTPDSARLTTQSPTSPQLAAYAASHPYPTTATSSDQLKAAAIVNRQTGVIKIYNFDSKPIRDAEVWVNKAYVQRISGIAPNSSALIRMGELYDGLGQSFSSISSPVSLVQIQMDRNLYTVQGPAAE